MSKSRDDMVINPSFKAPSDSGPKRRIREERKQDKAKKRRLAIAKKMKSLRKARRAQNARARSVKAPRGSGGMAAKISAGAARIAGPVGVALVIMDAIGAAGRVARRAEGGISGRLLDAQDQDAIYGDMDEQATGAANARATIEGKEDLLRIIGSEGRVNSQIGALGAYFKEKETAMAMGADLIEREPGGFDHLESVTDKAIEKGTSAIKSGADSAINGIRWMFGKDALTR